MTSVKGKTCITLRYPKDFLLTNCVLHIRFFRNTTFLVDAAECRKFGRWEEKKDGSVLLCCNHRPKRNPCKCYVKQEGNTFSNVGQHSDSCHSVLGLDLKLTLLREAKKTSSQSQLNLFFTSFFNPTETISYKKFRIGVE